MTESAALNLPASAAAALPSATVVVPTRNRGELVPETLRALMRIQHSGLDILVVDQSTDDRTRQAVEKEASCDR
ncbi:MAG TPA: glycosyltransferase family A protein, partial [Gemmatimonadaceae bacterium]|nr:glycosyltransferase family A protein [Gemmatimonadaceae bacterium]